MSFKKNIFISLFFSQILVLWVFWLGKNQYYVIEPQKKLCSVFEKWTTNKPNWLQENWQAIFLTANLEKKFTTNEACISWDSAVCCEEMGYTFSPSTTASQETVSEGRFAAEFLASKNIINPQSFSPWNYELKNFVTRKEFIKVILNASEKKIIDKCTKIFWDVTADWWCKYIESALAYEFIESNLRFRPNENVTKVEALKLIFQAKNIQKRYNTLYWQEDYISSAYYLWYIDSKFKDYNSYASREWIFQILARTYTGYSYKKQ